MLGQASREKRSVKWARGQGGDKMDPGLFPLDLEGTVARSDYVEAARGLQLDPEG